MPVYLVLLLFALLLHVVPVGDAHLERALYALDVFADDVGLAGEPRGHLGVELVYVFADE